MNGSTKKPTRRLTIRKRLVFTILPVFVLLLLAECIAWVFDWQTGYRGKLVKAYQEMTILNEPVTPITDLPWPDSMLAVRPPGDGSPPKRPYMVAGQAIPDANPNDQSVLVYPRDIVSPEKKRLFIVGGSAAFGFPYAYQDTFAGKLNESLKDHGYDILNASQVAQSSGVLVPIVHRVVDQYDPSVVVLFVGNNEWIQWMPENQPHVAREQLDSLQFRAHSRLLAALQYHSLKRSVAHRSDAAQHFVIHKELSGAGYALQYPSDNQGFDPQAWLATKQKYLDTFEENLRQMIQYTQSHRVKVIALTVPFNYKLSPAWKHPQPESFAIEHREEVLQAIRSGAKLCEDGEYDLALGKLDSALQLDKRPPILHYLKGQCLEQLGRPMEAEASYAQSREHMVGNLGSRLSINEAIVRTAEQAGAQIVDVRQLFDDYEHKRNKYFNEELIHDDCHPTPLGHSLISKAVAELVVKDVSK